MTARGDLQGQGGAEPPRPVTELPLASPDPADFIRPFNARSSAHEDLWARVFHAGDALRQATGDAALAEQRAEEDSLAHLAIQAEQPTRRASRPRQFALAGCTVALDAVACGLAAEALGNDWPQTLAWAALFLAVLTLGEAALDLTSRRRSRRAWRVIAGGLGAFIACLGVLRFIYLNTTVGLTDGLLAALVGAVLFTAATGALVWLGYRALRAAETGRAWRARRRARKSAAEAERAAEDRAECAAERDRLADAYLSRIRPRLLEACTASQLPRLEAAVRAHLLREEPG